LIFFFFFFKKKKIELKIKGLPPAFAPSWATPPKVLLVEDDKTCQQYAARILQV